MNRRKKRELSKKAKIPFQPNYNGKVYTYEEFYGVGNERFNSKYMTVKKGNEE